MNAEFTPIDALRQKFFNIYTKRTHESFFAFFEIVHSFLKKDLVYDIASELFSEVTRCFSNFSEECLLYLPEFLDKSRSNSNYIYITSSILFELIHNKIHVDIQYYQSAMKFIDDSLKEVIQQLSNENDKLIIFGQQIQPQMVNNLILNLFYLSNLKKDIFSTIFPHIFLKNYMSNNSKFELILQNLLKNGYFQLTDASNPNLLEILTHDLKIPNNKIDEKTLIFFSMVILFTLNESEMEINGLSTENVLPFAALTILYHKKHLPVKKITFSKINDLLLNSLNENKDSVIFSYSIDTILNNLEYLYDKDIVTTYSILQIIMILLRKLINKNFCGNKNLLLSIFFNYSNYSLSEHFKKFIDSNQTDLFDLIFDHLMGNECNIHFSLNLEIFDSSLLIERVQKLENNDEIIKTFHIIDNYCTKVPDLSLLSES